MKKLALVLLVVASLVLGALTMASCDMPTEIAGIQIPEIKIPEIKIDLPFDLPFLNKECKHQFVEEVTKAATCTEEGEKTLTCSLCGETQTEVIAALGHDFATRFTTDLVATCAAEGQKSKHCSRCDAVTEVTVIAKADHEWEETYTVDKEATCTENGQRSYHCEVCGAIDESRLNTIAAPGHNLDFAFTADTPKTCTTDGWESIHCQNCDYTEQGRAIPASHDWDSDYTIDVPATCTTAGSKSIHCLGCDEVKDVTEIVSHHEFGDDAVITKPSTLYSTGLKEGKCAKCGEDLSEVISATVQVLDGSLGAKAYIGSTKIGSVETDATEWIYKTSIGNLVDDDHKYYPTEADPEGNAVMMEFSILVNESMDYAISTSKTSIVLRVQKGGTKTNLGYIDFLNDDYPDAAGTWISGGEKTTYTGPLKDDGESQKASRLELGWHRIGFKLRQSVIAEDASEQPLTLNELGQLANPETDTIAKLTYVWTFEYYVDGVLDRSSTYVGMASGNNQQGIWNSDNLLYKATIGENGKTIIYADSEETESYFRLSMSNAFLNGSTIKTVLADAYTTIGKDFVQQVTPIAADYNGGKPVANAAYDGTDYLFPNACYYQVVGADANPEIVPAKGGYVFDGWVNGVAQWSIDPNHTTHTPDTDGITVDYTASIFAAGKQHYTCEICGQLIEEELAQLTPTMAYSANNHGDGSVESTNFDLYKKTSSYYSEAEDFMVEFSVFYNESFASDETNNGDTSVNFRPFKDAGNAVATLDFKTGNFYLKNCVAEDLENGISAAPDIMLTPGWHRLGFQMREEVTFDAQDNPVYTIKLRLFVDGVLMNPTGTWSVMDSSKAKTWFTASKDGDVITYSSSYSRYDNMARCGDFWRTNTDKVNYYGFVMFDDVQAQGIERTDSEIYSELFNVNVTPIDATRASYAFGGNKVVFDLDGGEFATLTYTGTKVDTKDNGYANSEETYTAVNNVWFQIVGAATLAAPAPTRAGSLFFGWDEGTVDEEAHTITYKAIWVDEHEHNFVRNAELDVAPSCGVPGAELYECSICGAKQSVPVDALEHNYVLNADESTAPTCLEAGENVYYCSICSEKKTEVVAALGHDFEKHGELTEVFAFRTADQWTNNRTSKGDLQVNESVVTTEDGDGYLLLTGNGSGGSGKYGYQMSLAGIPEDADTLVVTASIYREKVGDNAIMMPLTVRIGDPAGTNNGFIGIENKDTAGYSDGDVAQWDTDVPIAHVADYDGKWLDITIVITISTGEIKYYVNGTLVPEATATFTLPTTAEDMASKVIYIRQGGSMAKNSKVRIDNYAVYAGKINHYALDAIFAASNASATEIAPLPLDADDYNTYVAATCTADGSYTLKCTRCDYVEEAVVIEAFGHDYVVNADESTEATCVSDGETVSYCSRCGDKKTEVVAAAGQHNWVLVPENCVAPGCETDGSDAYICSVCSETKTEVVPATGHDFEAHKADDLTAIFHFTDWATTEGLSLTSNSGKGDSGCATSVTRKGTYLELKGGYDANLDAAKNPVLAKYTLPEMEAAANYVLTVSLNGAQNGGGNVGATEITLFDGEGKGYCLISISRTGGNVWTCTDGGVSDTDVQLGCVGAAGDGWFDVTIVLDTENDTATYYVNGVLVATQGITLPDTFASVNINRGTTANGGIVMVDNFSFYAGEANHASIDAVFAANNASGTELVASDCPNYVDNGDGTESLVCIHKGCTEKGETRPIAE